MSDILNFSKNTDQYFFIDFSSMLTKTLINVINNRMKQFHISYSQSRLLLLLFEDGGLNQRNLSDKLNIEPATAVRTLDRMEREKLIQRVRSDHDRREINVFLTDKGRALYPSILAVYKELENEMTIVNKKTNLKCIMTQVHNVFLTDKSGKANLLR